MVLEECEYKEGIAKFPNNKYKCIICVDYKHKIKHDIGSLKEHLESKKHRETLKIYKQYFCDDYDNFCIKCLICHTKIQVSNFFYHARFHKLRPWNTFKNILEQLFKNYILLEGGNYQCYLCKKNFFYHRQIINHFESKEHNELLKNKFPEHHVEFLNFQKAEITHYLDNYLFPVSGKLAWCWVCDIKISTSSITHHTENHHAINKQNNQSLPVSEKTKYDQSKLSFACGICDVRFREKSHVDLSSHKNKMKMLEDKLRKSNHLEDLPIGLKLNINGDDNNKSLHIDCLEHCENLANIYDDNLLANNNKNNLPKEIILTAIDDVFYCSTCRYTIKSIGKVQLHIENKNHKQSKIFSPSKTYLKLQLIPKEDVELLENTTETSTDQSDISGYHHEQRIRMNQKDESSLSVELSCKPCKFHLYGDIYDIIPDWNHHLTTMSHCLKKV